MDSDNSSSDDEFCIKNDTNFEEESVTKFAFEMFHYLLARRLCDSYHKGIIPFGSTKFSEEIGKAVLLKWYEENKSFRKILSDDFPKYINSRESFLSYATNRCVELDDIGQSAVDRILKITAFLLEMASYCYEKGFLDFTYYVHEDWTKIFLDKCGRSLKGVGGWLTLVKTCAEKSTLYDRRGIEKKGEITTFILEYLTPSGRKPPSYDYPKYVTKFQTYDLKTESFIPPPPQPAVFFRK